MILVLIVGTIFTCVAAIILYVRMLFQRYADRVPGTVIAIEKRVVHSSNNSSSVHYIPVVEYAFNGEPVLVSLSAGTGTLNHSIGEVVELLSFPTSPEAVQFSKSQYVAWVVGFGGVGLATLAIFFFVLEGSLDFKLTAGGIDVALLAAIAVAIRSRFSGEQIFTAFTRNATVETESSLEQKTLYRTQAELDELERGWNRIGLAISSVFLLGSIGVFVFAAINLPDGVTQSVSEWLKNTSQTSILVAQIKKPPVILFLASLVFILLGIHSLRYSLKRM
jgi:hypothetical protein